MPVSVEMKNHLAGNFCTLCSVWKITARDGTIIGATNHTRNLVYDGTTYYAIPLRPTELQQKAGLSPDNAEMFAPLTSTLTEADLIGQKWSGARVEMQVVNYMDLTMGYARRSVGYLGEVTIRNGTVNAELRGLSQILSQPVGDLTSPTDRIRQLGDAENKVDLDGNDEQGLSITRTTEVHTTPAPTRQVFTVTGTARANNYYQYGWVEWTSGANNGLKMEIKSNVGNAITLSLPMRSTIAVGDDVKLIAGYDRTREQARVKFDSVIDGRFEPDLPGLEAALRFPD